MYISRQVSKFMYVCTHVFYGDITFMLYMHVGKRAGSSDGVTEMELHIYSKVRALLITVT